MYVLFFSVEASRLFFSVIPWSEICPTVHISAQFINLFSALYSYTCLQLKENEWNVSLLYPPSFPPRFGHKKEKHTGAVEIFPCPDCGKNFSRKSNLKVRENLINHNEIFYFILTMMMFSGPPRFLTFWQEISLFLLWADFYKSELNEPTHQENPQWPSDRALGTKSELRTVKNCSECFQCFILYNVWKSIFLARLRNPFVFANNQVEVRLFVLASRGNGKPVANI